MKIAIGADHAGYELKTELVRVLKSHHYEVVDVGICDMQSCDYPDYALAVAEAVANHDVERGIMICGSGIGASIAVNKVPGIRGGICHDTYSAHQGVEHDDMNVLVMGSRVIGPALAIDIMMAFLGASFSNESRHLRRLEKIKQIEERFSRGI